MRRFLATFRFVILLTLTHMLMVVVGAVLLLLSCLPEIWEILMRTLFTIAFVALSVLPAAADALCDYIGRPCPEKDRAIEESLRDSRRAADDAFRDAKNRIDMERHDLDQWSINAMDRRLPPMPPPLPR